MADIKTNDFANTVGQPNNARYEKKDQPLTAWDNSVAATKKPLPIMDASGVTVVRQLREGRTFG